MSWEVIATDTFSKQLRKHKKNSELISALDNKIKRLSENPHNVGKYLSGSLHGKKSSRLVRKFRLIFEIDDGKNKVFLIAIDHRQHAYD